MKGKAILKGAALLLLCGFAPPPPKSTPAPAVQSAWSDDLYTLGREALGKGSFETAVHLFRAIEDDPRWGKNARYTFNRAQAHRYAGSPGEAIYWYGRYLALEPAATDAAATRDQISRLVRSSPGALRAFALEMARSDFEREIRNPELARALDEAPRARLEVRFTKISATRAAPEAATAFLFPARIVFWSAAEGDAPDADWEAWVVPSVPIVPPEELATPPLLFLPPGRPFPVSMGPDLVSSPTTLQVPPRPYFPVDPETAAWRIEVVAQVSRTGPPLLLRTRRSGATMSDVHSGPAEGPLTIGRRHREIPAEPTPLAFGPRLPRDTKSYGRILVAVLDQPGKEGTVERWGAPIGQLDVVNRFGRLVPGSEGPMRVQVRNEDSGPFLIPLAEAFRLH